MPADALWTAATGMLAQQTSMDATANNLANVNTTGFKRGRTAFQDLLYTKLTPQEAAAQGVAGRRRRPRRRRADRSTSRAPCSAPTSRSTWPSRARASSRSPAPTARRATPAAGNFTTNAAGKLTHRRGRPVSPGITIPRERVATSRSAPPAWSRPRVAGKSTRLGQIGARDLLEPVRPLVRRRQLLRRDRGQRRGPRRHAGATGAGSITQGALEGSNVNAVDEMVGMVSTQRAYEAVSKVISASDEMLGQANQLRRG